MTPILQHAPADHVCGAELTAVKQSLAALAAKIASVTASLTDEAPVAVRALIPVGVLAVSGMVAVANGFLSDLDYTLSK